MCFYPVASKHNERHIESGMKSTVMIFFQPKAVRMTILSRLTTLTHLDDILITEEEAAKAAQVAAGSKINQVRILENNNLRPGEKSLCVYFVVVLF